MEEGGEGDAGGGSSDGGDGGAPGSSSRHRVVRGTRQHSSSWGDEDGAEVGGGSGIGAPGCSSSSGVDRGLWDGSSKGSGSLGGEGDGADLAGSSNHKTMRTSTASVAAEGTGGVVGSSSGGAGGSGGAAAAADALVLKLSDGEAVTGLREPQTKRRKVTTGGVSAAGLAVPAAEVAGSSAGGEGAKISTVLPDLGKAAAWNAADADIPGMKNIIDLVLGLKGAPEPVLCKHSMAWDKQQQDEQQQKPEQQQFSGWQQQHRGGYKGFDGQGYPGHSGNQQQQYWSDDKVSVPGKQTVQVGSRRFPDRD